MVVIAVKVFELIEPGFQVGLINANGFEKARIVTVNELDFIFLNRIVMLVAMAGSFLSVFIIGAEIEAGC